MKALEEIGKGFIALANLTLVLIFFKGYQDNSNIFTLIFGVIFAIVIYAVGYTLINKSEKEK